MSTCTVLSDLRPNFAATVMHGPSSTTAFASAKSDKKKEKKKKESTQWLQRTLALKVYILLILQHRQSLDLQRVVA